MPLQPIQFATNSYLDRSRPIESQQLVNLYLEAKPGDAKNQVALHGTPGLELFVTVGLGPIRGMIEFEEVIYVVSGGELYRVEQSGSSFLVGLISGTQPVSMAINKTQVVIASDFDVYVAEGVLLTQHTTMNNVSGVAFLDGYGIFSKKDDDRFFISALNDFKIVDLTDNTQLNILPQTTQGVKVSNRQLWVFGEKTTVVYYNSGQADFPFSRIPSGVIQRGALAPKSIVEYQGILFWLGDDNRIYVSDGYVPRVISTSAIDRQIDGYVLPEDAVGFVYQEEGHIFYVLTFSETTWVYDLSTQLWHERRSFGLNNWRARNGIFQFLENYVGDYSNGNIYKLNLDLFTDNGTIIQRIATSPPLNAQGFRASQTQFYLDMETGVGLPLGQGNNPQAMLDWSDDGGFTFSSEHWSTFGPQGQRYVRARWFRMGQFNQRTMRVTISDPVKVCIIQAYSDLEVSDQ